MKKILFIVFLSFGISANATFSLEYFIYVEKEYFQGPWIGLDQIETANNHYLSPVSFEDNFGSDELEMALKFLWKLKELKPESYNWDYKVHYKSNTVFIEVKSHIENWPVVKDEITATMTMNSFDAVEFQFEDSTVTATMDDISMPYLGLIDSGESVDPVNGVVVHDVKSVKVPSNQVDSQEEESKSSNYWVIFFFGLNALVLIYVFRKKKK